MNSLEIMIEAIKSGEIFNTWCHNPKLDVYADGESISCSGWMIPIKIRQHGEVTTKCDMCGFINVCAYDSRAIGIDLELFELYKYRGDTEPNFRTD
jgi:hypothetical protein